VTNPIIKDGIKSYVIYTLIYKNQKDNPIHRRFSDFYALRAKLLERWPGVFIPNIPPKKAVVNLILI
jgi:sorting nexin-1/2